VLFTEVFIYLPRPQSHLARINLPLTTNTSSLFFPSTRLRNLPLSTSSSAQPRSLAIRPFVTTSIPTNSQEAFAMDDFEDSFDNIINDESDAFSPEKPVKKAAAKKAATAKPTTTKKATTSTAPKKAAAPKSDKPKAPAKPRTKKPKVTEEIDDGLSFEMDRTFNVLETPQLSSEGPSPPRPTVLQEQNGPTKNASETYQKVFPSLQSANF
jgi:hypothetical protein